MMAQAVNATIRAGAPARGSGGAMFGHYSHAHNASVTTLNHAARLRRAA